MIELAEERLGIEENCECIKCRLGRIEQMLERTNRTLDGVVKQTEVKT